MDVSGMRNMWNCPSELEIIHEVDTLADIYMEHCIMNYTSTDHQVSVVKILKKCVNDLKELQLQ